MHPLRENDPRPGLVPGLMGVGAGQPVEVRMAAAQCQRQIVVIVVAGVAVDDFGAVNGVLKNCQVAVPVGVSTSLWNFS